MINGKKGRRGLLQPYPKHSPIITSMTYKAVTYQYSSSFCSADLFLAHRLVLHCKDYSLIGELAGTKNAQILFPYKKHLSINTFHIVNQKMRQEKILFICLWTKI